MIGVRPVPGEPKIPREEQIEVDPDPDGNTSGGGGDGLWSEEDAEAEAERQNECAAKKLELAIKLPGSNSNWREFFSHTWVARGETRTQAAVEGTGIPQSPADQRIRLPTRGDFNSARERFGVRSDGIVAINHNHPRNAYCRVEGVIGDVDDGQNRFPSINDWSYAAELVEGGANPETLTLYITDCEGETRAFPYVDRVRFSNDRDEKRSPPPKIDPEDCPSEPG